MSRSRRSKFLALKLVALAAICSVGLIALPAVASASVPVAPVCSITANDGQNVAEGHDATPVAFTCTDNGDGPITFFTGGAGQFGNPTLDANGHSLDYTANAFVSGTDTVYLFANTANSTASTLTFTYNVTDAAPVCTPINETLQGGLDEQLFVDYSASCSDPDGDTLSYTVTDSSGASGTLDEGNPGLYNESADHADDTTQFTDSFQVTVSDGNPDDDTIEAVNITVTPNHPPTCTVNSGDDHQSALHGGAAIAIGIHCSDPDTSVIPGNDDFSVEIDPDSLSRQGYAQLNDNSGVITYTPTYNGLGADTIAVLVMANNDAAMQSTLLVHVNVTDAAPACSDVALSMTNDSSDGADLACTDADGDFIGYDIGQAPLNGSIYQSGSFFAYIPNAGFVGTDTFTVLADDGAIQTPITVTSHVSAAPPVVVPPVVVPVDVPVVTPPVVTPPVVVPPVVIVTPPAPKLSSPVTVKDGKVALELGCANTTTSCKASVGLSTTIAGKTVSLGQKTITIEPGKNGAIKVALSGAAKKALKAFVGKTITVKVAVVTTNPKTGKTVTVIKALKVKVPR